MSGIVLSDLLSVFNPIGQSITIADALKPDMPLVYANKGFEHFSGYTREEVIGRNSRWLQGNTKDQESVRIMRDAIARESACIVDVINFRKDGSRMVNRLSLRPLFDENNSLRYYIGLQSDVTALNDIEEKIIAYMSSKTLISQGCSVLMT